MVKVISKLYLAALFIIFVSCFVIQNVDAQSVNISGPTPTPENVPGIVVPNETFGDRIIYPGNEEVSVSARVGEFIVNLSGLSSPNASVVLEDSDGTFLRSTVADPSGYFYISNLSVRRGFDGFCLESIDFERIGNSNACLDIEPIEESRDIADIFLPPTIGLYDARINAGGEALIFGYSMPNADVDVRIVDGLTFEAKTDEKGYYEYRYRDVPAGKYLLNSVAEFQGLQSLEPRDSVELEVLTLPEQIVTTTQDTIKDTGELLTQTNFGFFFLIVALLLIIFIITLLLLKPTLAQAIFDKFKKRNALHHDWLLEFIDMNSAK